MKFKCLFVILVLIMACGPNQTGEEPLETNNAVRTADDVKNDFNNFILNEGINDLTLESLTENDYWNFRLIVPADASEINKKPLIISLHGGAQNDAPNAHKSTDCLISPGTEGVIDAFILNPNSNSKLWYEQYNQIQILALYDLATSYLPIDIDKVAITGYSDGGNGSWFFAQYYSHMFSAAIPMASSYNTVKSNGEIDPIEIPLYVIHGENDLLFPLETTAGYVNESIAAGSVINFRVASGLDHYQVCEYSPYLREATLWLANTVWN